MASYKHKLSLSVVSAVAIIILLLPLRWRCVDVAEQKHCLLHLKETNLRMCPSDGLQAIKRLKIHKSQARISEVNEACKTSWIRPIFNGNQIGCLQTNMVVFPSNTGNVNTFRYFLGTFQIEPI